MTTISDLGSDIAHSVAKTTEQAVLACSVFRETGTITANGTVNFYERLPGSEKVVLINYGDPFARGKALEPAVFGLDGKLLAGEGAGGLRYNKVFLKHPEITTVSHVHSPYLGAWAQTHRTLPIRYVPVQRFLLKREFPNYIDRRQPEQDYILEQLVRDAQLPAILEANGGSTVWAKKACTRPPSSS